MAITYVHLTSFLATRINIAILGQVYTKSCIMYKLDELHAYMYIVFTSFRSLLYSIGNACYNTGLSEGN